MRKSLINFSFSIFFFYVQTETRNQIAEKLKAAETTGTNGNAGGAAGEKRRRRWDQAGPVDDDPKAKKAAYGEVRELIFFLLLFFMTLFYLGRNTSTSNLGCNTSSRSFVIR